MRHIKKSDFLNIQNQIVTIGSCFADNIADVLQKNKFDVASNPFGIIYHPTPLLKVLEDSISTNTATSKEFFHHDGLWRWWYGHGSVAAKELSMLEKTIESSKAKIQKYLFSENSVLIITLGTSFLFETLENSMPVANCHKMPASEFKRRFTPYQEFLDDWINTIEFLLKKNPSLQLIFTVSPVRHLKDGLHENNLSKANLLLFVRELLGRFPDTTSYFHAYEIMIDVLRDYQYYKEDKIHPNEKAIKYIQNEFSEQFMSPDTHLWINKLNALQNELAHRPLHPHSDSFQKFITSLHKKLSDIMNEYPKTDWKPELERLDYLKSLSL